MIQIIPAVLETTEAGFKKTIFRLSSCEVLNGNWVHIDFADNNFVQNKTVEPKVISEFPVNFKKEAHLMVSHPKDWIDKLIEAGFERIIFHIESKDHTDEVIDDIKSKGLEVGLAINMDTPIEKLQAFVSKIDVILVMSIVPGFQGQLFIEASLDRIKQIKSENWPVKVGIDGAVRDNNIKKIVKAGADYVTVGSFLLKGDIEENLEELWEVIRDG